MAACEFSEFSYGFALTHSFVGSFSSALGRAPIFPSLIQEGSSGGGYDVKLPLVPFAIFLQFKIPSVLTRSSSLKPTAYSIPYYRFPFRTKKPNQHQLLLDLAATQPLVSYVAPLFHQLSDLDRFFSLGSVHRHSTFVSPSQIGPLDAMSHQLSYRPGETVFWLRSNPKAIEHDFSYDGFAAKLELHRDSMRSELKLFDRQVNASEANERRRHLFIDLRDRMVELERKARASPERPSDTSGAIEKLAAVSPISAIEEGDEGKSTPIFRLENLDPPEMAKRLAFIAQVRFGLILALGEAANPTQST